MKKYELKRVPTTHELRSALFDGSEVSFETTMGIVWTRILTVATLDDHGFSAWKVSGYIRDKSGGYCSRYEFRALFSHRPGSQGIFNDIGPKNTKYELSSLLALPDDELSYECQQQQEIALNFKRDLEVYASSFGERHILAMRAYLAILLSKACLSVQFEQGMLTKGESKKHPAVLGQKA